jgi:hypothetical protein
MDDVPDRIDLDRHRELASIGFHRPIRYIALALIVAVVLAGALNVFGQHPKTSTATSAKASLEVYAASRLRGGLLYMARFTIYAHRPLTHAVLQLSPGWAESQQINTIEPSPVAQTSRNGSLLFTLGAIPEGEHYTLYVEFQVNPTNIGHRSEDTILYDGDARLLTIRRKLTVFP